MGTAEEKVRSQTEVRRPTNSQKDLREPRQHKLTRMDIPFLSTPTTTYPPTLSTYLQIYRLHTLTTYHLQTNLQFRVTH